MSILIILHEYNLLHTNQIVDYDKIIYIYIVLHMYIYSNAYIYMYITILSDPKSLSTNHHRVSLSTGNVSSMKSPFFEINRHWIDCREYLQEIMVIGIRMTCHMPPKSSKIKWCIICFPVFFKPYLVVGITAPLKNDGVRQLG